MGPSVREDYSRSLAGQKGLVLVSRKPRQNFGRLLACARSDSELLPVAYSRGFWLMRINGYLPGLYGWA